MWFSFPLRKHSPVGVLTETGNIIILKIRYITLIESNIDKIRYILSKMYTPLLRGYLFSLLGPF